MIERKYYINQLLSCRWNGKVKIVTGIRRSGKSFLLSQLYREYLLNEGVGEDQIVMLDLEKKSQVKYRNPLTLYDYVVSRTSDLAKRYYVFIDEIQLCYKVKTSDTDEQLVPAEQRDLLYTTFYDVLSDLKDRDNVDIYVTGSNSRMLSSDLVTNFRDRGTEIRLFPLSFAEYYPVSTMDKVDAFEEYLNHGGMPLAVLESDERRKREYLRGLHRRVYYKDILERYALKDDAVLDALVDSLYSSVGSLSNVHNLTAAASALMDRSTTDHTVKQYLDYLEDAYLVQEAKRYDVKGKRYFDYPQKYYAMDLGLRNAKLNFRQQDRGHLMENVIFNELIRRGYSVDVGVVDVERRIGGKRQQSQYEIDFVVNTGSGKVYIQSAWSIDDDQKREQETFSLRHTSDFFRKMVLLGGNQKPWTDESGITYMGVIPFLLSPDPLSEI